VRRGDRRSHIVPIMLGCTVTVGAIALVAYLLWPTWEVDASNSPARLPVSIGATLFNVPTAAIRMKIQRHSGPQERVDLNFSFPSLEPPDAPKHMSVDSVEGNGAADRPHFSYRSRRITTRWRRIPGVRTIYPRYLEQNSTPGQDGLTMRAFSGRARPYSNEDLFFRQYAEPDRALHPRRDDARNVPEASAASTAPI